MANIGVVQISAKLKQPQFSHNYTFVDALSTKVLIFTKNITFALPKNAGVAKLADALDLGSSAARHGGSSPSARTNRWKRVL